MTQPAPCDIYDPQFFISIWSIGGSFGHFGGSANRTTMDLFEKFSTFSYTKSKFKWGPFYKKMPTHVFDAPFCGPF
jgi:hypothetical protein